MDGPAFTLVTDQLPCPPRNGVTLPLFHYLEQMRSTHRITVCLLHAEDAAPAPAALADNEHRYGPIVRVPLRRQALPQRVLAELATLEMVQHGWRPAAPATARAALQAADFEQVLVSPVSALAKWRALQHVHPALQPRTTVAAVHDCTAAEYHHRWRSAPPGAAARTKARLDALRVPLIARIEAQLLAGCARVLVQTEADLQAMHTLVGEATAARCVVAPNGVQPSLFDLQPRRGEQVLFVAELSGEYAHVAEWLCTAVWPRVHAVRPGARLTIVGRGASPRLQACMASTAGAEHLAFAPDLAPVYAAAGLVWSPVFKGFGLINKTLEALASGLPVLGGQAAFNGLQGFVDGVHGLALPAADAPAWAAATLRLLESPPQRAALGEAGRDLVRHGFRWQHSADVLRQAFARPGAAPARARPVPAPVLAEPR